MKRMIVIMYFLWLIQSVFGQECDGAYKEPDEVAVLYSTVIR